MKNNEMPEMLLMQACNSTKLRKFAIGLVLAGIVICIIPLLPPVQNVIFSFVDSRLSRKGTGDLFENRLISLLSLPFFGLVVLVFALCCLFSGNIAGFFGNRSNAKLVSAMAAGLGMLLLCFISFFSCQYGEQWLNSDHSSEMVLAELLAEEGVFVSSNWDYSTEIRIIYQTLFTMPLFKLLNNSGSWPLIRSLGILLNNLLYISSYFFMMKQMKIQTKYIMITSLLLVLPLSIGCWDIVIFGGYYIFFIAQLFCCLGLFIRLACQNRTAKTSLFGFLLFSVLSFVLGIQGIRSLLSVHIPLLIASICLYSAGKEKRIFTLFLGCFGFIVCFLGFAASYLLHFWFSFHSFDNMRLAGLFAEFFPKLGQCIACLTEFFGFISGKSLLSAQGLFSVAAAVGAAVFFWAVIRAIRREKQPEIRVLSVFFITSAVFNIFVFILVDEPVTFRYFIPFMVLCIPFTAVLFTHAEKTFAHLKYTAVFCGILLFVFGQSHLNFQSLAALDINKNRKGYIQYLLDNKLEFGFATFWNANVTTELSSGKVELLGLSFTETEQNKNRLSFHNWLVPKKLKDPSYYQGESFMLFTRSEWELVQKADRAFTRNRPDYEDTDFLILRFPSSGVIHREILDQQ